MTQQVRLILAIAISIAIIGSWTYFFAPKRRPVSKPAAVAAATTPPEVAKPAAPVIAQGDAANPAAPTDLPPELVTVETPSWKAVFTTAGAGLTSFELLGAKLQHGSGDSARPVNLAHAGDKQPLPLSVEIPDVAGLGPRTIYAIASRTPESIVFERESSGVRVQKTVRWKAAGGYLLGVDVKITRADGSLAPKARLNYASLGPPPQSAGFMGMGGRPDIHRTVCHLEGKGRSVEQHVYDADKFSVTPEGTAEFAAVDEKYFLAAMAPAAAGLGATCTLASSEPGALEARLDFTPPPAGASFDVFLGPKEAGALAAAGHHLDTSVDYGFFAVICEILLRVLAFFQGLLGNWGLAIVLLTICMKALTFPLTHRQMKSMEEMKRLAPKIEELKVKYAGDANKLNVETMKLYKDHNANPLGGCLPMLIQLPVWFALYSMLATSFELYREPFISGWILDLTSKDPFYVLPVLMTVTMVVTQVLTPQTAQAEQMKFLLYGMPIFFGFIMLSLPAGLVLYIFTNNLLSIAQSLWFRRLFAKPALVPAK